MCFSLFVDGIGYDNWIWCSSGWWRNEWIRSSFKSFMFLHTWCVCFVEERIHKERYLDPEKWSFEFLFWVWKMGDTRVDLEVTKVEEEFHHYWNEETQVIDLFGLEQLGEDLGIDMEVCIDLKLGYGVYRAMWQFWFWRIWWIRQECIKSQGRSGWDYILRYRMDF